jgi:Flp pilus assembly protein TadG
MKNFVDSESGQMLAMTGVMMAVLVGLLGMAIDVGLLYRTKQNAQIAADAGAVAGVQNLLFGGTTSTAQTAAKTASGDNGFTDGSGGVTVTVNNPPTSGPNQTNAFIEVIVAKNSPLTFASYIGQTSMTVAARAVAGTPVYGNACIWLMAPTGNGLSVQGSYNINVNQCGIYVNSITTDAINVTGNSGSLTAKFLDTPGNVTPQHPTSPTPITKNTAPRKNPFGNLSGPDPTKSAANGGCTATFPAAGTSSIAITTTNMATYAADSGTTNGSIVCFKTAVSLSNGVSLPGLSGGAVYVFEQGLTISTGASVTFGSFDPSCTTCSVANNVMGPTDGATIDLYGGSFTQQSNSVLNMYAPTAGTYNAIGIMQPTRNTTTPLQIQFGSNSTVFDGYVYAPNTTVYMQDSGGTGVKDMGIVAYSMNVQTSTFTISSYDVANAATTPNRIVSLVE